MTEWTCPNCHGGFPEPVNDARNGTSECPWCGHVINGSYEFEPKTVSYTGHTDEPERTSILDIFR